MEVSTRRTVFVIAAAGLAGLLLYGLAGLPPFGHYHGPYGIILNAVAPHERHVTNVVSAVNFDYRGLDTLGEEFILFAAVAGVALLLRDNSKAATDTEYGQATPRSTDVPTEAVRTGGIVFLGVTLLFAIYIGLHAHLTPGGGFQGGSIFASGWILVFLVGGSRVFRQTSPKSLIEAFDALGAGLYAVIGLITLATGAAFLQNIMPLGTLRSLLSGGTITTINGAVGVEVAAGVILVLGEFVSQLEEKSHSANGQKEE